MIPLTPVEVAELVDGRVLSPAGGPEAGGLPAVSGPVETDSRRVVPGAVFFALRGEETDGHRFVEQAVAAGAALVVAERELSTTVPVVLVADGVTALSALAHGVVERVRRLGRLRVSAVTGSNGKTSTKNMLRAVLGDVGATVAPRGSFNNHVGAPVSMLGIDETTEHLVVEMGAAGPGEIAKLVAVARPDVGVVLKVGLAHAGGFGGIEGTRRAKAEMVTDLSSADVAVLNADDDRVASMAGETVARVVTFGLSDDADHRATDVEVTASGTRFTYRHGDLVRPVSLRILGEHHVMNALATLAVAAQHGLDLDRACTVLEGVARAERWRMEVLEAPGGVTVVNDAYNASPDSVAAALKTLVQITGPGRRAVAVLGEMSELGEQAQEEHDRLGRLVVRLGIPQLVVVGHAARHVHMAAGLEGSWDGESVFVEDADEAEERLRELLREGDVVLVKSSNSAGLRLLGDRLAGVDA